MTKFRWFLLAALTVVSADWLIVNHFFLKLSPYAHDELLGWAPKQEFSRTYAQKDAAGNSYKAFFSLERNGFRTYGETATRRKKILFIGDSYTGDRYTGNNEMYFSVVKSTLGEKYAIDTEIFAAGGGGYSTLQEFLLIKKHIAVIKPDILVLQFCDNDFQNNLFEWESRGLTRCQFFLRPYYSKKMGGIYHASSYRARCYRYMNNRFFLFRRFDELIQKLQYKYYGDYSKKLSPREMQHLQQDAYEATREIFLLFKNELGSNTQLFTVNTSAKDKHAYDLWVKLSRESGFTPVLSPPLELERLESEGSVVRHADGGHLNILGNKIFGEALAQELSGYLRR